MKNLNKYTPIALGVVSGCVAALCLWVGAALMRVDGAGVVAFACVSGALFWCSGAAAAVMLWIAARNSEEEEAKNAARREAIRTWLRGGPRIAQL